MLLGRDLLAISSRSLALASPELGDTPAKMPGIILPTTTLQAPVQSFTSVISDISESTVRSSVLVYSIIGATSNQPLLNMERGVWRLKATCSFRIDVAASFNQDMVWFSLNRSASGAAGTQLGAVAVKFPVQASVEYFLTYEDTVAMAESFQICSNATAKAGSTIAVYATLIAHRLL